MKYIREKISLFLDFLKGLYEPFVDNILSFYRLIVSFFKSNSKKSDYGNTDNNEDIFLDSSVTIDNSLYTNSSFSRIVFDEKERDDFFINLVSFIKENSLSSDTVYYTFCCSENEEIPPIILKQISSFNFIGKIFEFSLGYDFLLETLDSGAFDPLLSDYLKKMIFSNNKEANYKEYSSYFRKFL